jgi:predicted NBD/HSP70 family sugar kinase
VEAAGRVAAACPECPVAEQPSPSESGAHKQQCQKLLICLEGAHARGLAHVVNIVDPDVLVLGGGLSQLSHLYQLLPQLMGPHIFADHGSVAIKAPHWGDASGSRGAARLWD